MHASCERLQGKSTNSVTFQLSPAKIHVEYILCIQEAGKNNLYLQGNNAMRSFQT